MPTLARTFGHLLGVAVVRAGIVLGLGAVGVGAAGVAYGAQDLVLTMAQPDSPLSVEGSISGVVAGAPSAPLTLTLRNDNDTAKNVTRVTAEPTGAVDGPATCRRADYLTTGEWNGAVTVPAHGTASVTIPVAVSAALPRECVHVTWGLAYTAY